MVLSFLYLAFVRMVQLVRLSCLAQDDLAIEVVMLRHEVAVLRRQSIARLCDQRPGVARGPLRFLGRCGGFFVQPATLLRWHRDSSPTLDLPAPPVRSTIGPRRNHNAHRPAGQENPTWGYRRICGELATMGIARHRRASGPSSSVRASTRTRRSGPTWAEFLRRQAKA